MIDIRGDGLFINVNHTSEWDTQLNNYAGGNKAIIQIDPGMDLVNMKADLVDLQSRFALFLEEQEREAQARANNPALKELYDQYRVVYKLVKKAEDMTSGASNSQ